MSSKMLRPQIVTSLFAGIGGFEMGLKAAGHQPSLFCEIDEEASAVLRGRFRRVAVVPDVRDTRGLINAIDPESQMLTAGFPCTDLSQAGRTLGFSGTQSSLIRDVFRLLDRRPFNSLLIENVPNWRVLHKGAYLVEVLSALEVRGYKWAYRTIDARAFGLPQRRQRIFLFATKLGDPRAALFRGNEAPCSDRHGIRHVAHGFYWTEGSRGLGWGEDCVPTLKGGSTVGIPSPPAIIRTDGSIITPDIRDAERLQGFPEEWTDFDIAGSGQSKRQFKQRRRWMLVGNAVNVEVAKWIGENLRSPFEAPSENGSEIASGQTMPPCAWFDGKQRYSANFSTWPVARMKEPLEKFLRYPGEPLSHRAASGFLKRATSSSLRFADGFLDAISQHVRMVELRASKSRTSCGSDSLFAFS